MAQGQAMIRTETVTTQRLRRVRPEQEPETAATSAITSTTGTKTAVTRSISDCTGRRADCASLDHGHDAREETVSEPTAVAR